MVWSCLSYSLEVSLISFYFSGETPSSCLELDSDYCPDLLSSESYDAPITSSDVSGSLSILLEFIYLSAESKDLCNSYNSFFFEDSSKDYVRS